MELDKLVLIEDWRGGGLRVKLPTSPEPSHVALGYVRQDVGRDGGQGGEELVPAEARRRGGAEGRFAALSERSYREGAGGGGGV